MRLLVLTKGTNATARCFGSVGLSLILDITVEEAQILVSTVKSTGKFENNTMIIMENLNND